MDNINDFNVNLDDAATCLLQPANCLPMVTALDRFHCTTYIRGAYIKNQPWFILVHEAYIYGFEEFAQILANLPYHTDSLNCHLLNFVAQRFFILWVLHNFCMSSYSFYMLDVNVYFFSFSYGNPALHG